MGKRYGYARLSPAIKVQVVLEKKELVTAPFMLAGSECGLGFTSIKQLAGHYFC